MSSPLFEITNLHASIGTNLILKGINLRVNAGEVHAIMGPNGSGKSTLALSSMGHPAYTITKGSITLAGVDITSLPADQKAKQGLFLGFQYPVAIPGVSVGNFLKKARDNQVDRPSKSLRQDIYKQLEIMQLERSFAGRSLNDGFSGGEKKRTELVQMAILEPKMVILDEIDSGLDIDGLKIVANSIKNYISPTRAVLLITHYDRILELIQPNFVHVMQDGRIVQSGDAALAQHLEKHGYLKSAQKGKS